MRTTSASTATPPQATTAGSTEDPPFRAQPIAIAAAIAATDAATRVAAPSPSVQAAPGCSRAAPHAARRHQRRRAQQAEPDQLDDLRPGPGSHPADPGADRERLTHGDHEQRQVGRQARAPGPHRDGQQHAERDHVGDRVNGLQGKGPGRLAGPAVLGPEHRHPADDEQGSGQQAGVGHPRQRPVGLGPARPAAVGTGLALRPGQADQAGAQGGQGEQ